MMQHMSDPHAATELKLFIDNDGTLYRSQTTSILKNLATKRARGEYRHDLAVKAFGYLVELGAKKYAKEFGGEPWHKMFDVGTRKLAAEALTQDFEGEAALGNYDDLLPKKYQKQEKGSATGHARKKSGGAMEARRRGITAEDIRDFRGFLHNATDSQVQGIYEKERQAGRDEYAELAVAEAERRGISLGRYDHARKKSPSQLKREISSVLGTKRYS